MGPALHVDVTDRERGEVVVARTIAGTPVRLGRDPLNDVVLPFSFVSQFHAKIDVSGGGFVVLDLGSRNGTCVGTEGVRATPHEPTDLASHGDTFSIGRLAIAVRFATESEAEPGRERGGALLSDVDRPIPTARLKHAGDAGAVEASVLGSDVREAYAAYRASWKRTQHLLVERMRALPPAARIAVAARIAAELPSALNEPEFRAALEELDVSLHGLGANARDEDVALEGLRELASWYRIPQRLEGHEAIVGFLRRIQDALDELFAAYVPLRDGMRRFEREFDVSRSRSDHSNDPLHAAKTPAAVATTVLDWTAKANAARSVRSVFADLMIHNMGLLTGVMKGASALIHQLSPNVIAETLSSEQRAGRASGGWGPWRYKALWEAYGRRHADFAEEERDAFALLFGREFAHAYEQLFDAAGRDDAQPSAEPIAKTPETHGMPAPKMGPTGTVVVPRVPAPRPNAGPMLERRTNPEKTR